jgi:hypothetical protein
VDFIIAVVMGQASNNNSNVYFELGLALGLDKRVLLLVEPSVSNLPFDLQDILSLRVPLTNIEAISFALDQLLSAPPKRHKPSSSTHKYTPMGARVDALLRELDHLEEATSNKGFESRLITLIEDALQQSGIETIVPSYIENRRQFDFALWVDELEPYVGNPFLIEVKLSLRSRSDIRVLASRFAETSARWALLLYPEPPSEKLLSDLLPPNILHLSIREFFKRMRSNSFPVVIRDLRNRRVHGTGA